MNDKIAIILEGNHHCKNYRQLLGEIDKDYPVYGEREITEQCTNPVELAKKVASRGTEVIISAGKYYEQIVNAVEVPVVKVRRSKISFATAVKTARNYSDKVAILAREGVFLDAALQYRALLGEKIIVEKFSDEKDIFKALEFLKAQGIKVLITGTRGRKYALVAGFHCVSVQFEPEDILDSIKEAEHILRYVESRMENTELLQSVQNSISEGLITLNDNGIITEINQPALALFAFPKEHFVGHDLKNTEFSDISRLKAYQNRSACSGEVLILNGNTVSLSINPIVVSNVNKALLISFNLVDQIQRHEQVLRAKLYNKGHVATYSFDKIIGSSAAMTELIEEAKKYAGVDSTIMINGPSGSGKEVFAQSIHNAGKRQNQPFVVINCAALSESLMESTLFGYEKGAYTGALKEGKKGLFEIAHGGTVFLDEVSEMSLDMQSRFLRVLQEKEISPVGSDRVIPIDVRVISATNRNMQQLVEAGRFREDLFYRLAVLWLEVPALSARHEDISELIRHFMCLRGEKLKISIPDIEPEAMRYLCGLDYPGNIRQLGNVVERILVLSDGQCVDIEMAKRASCIFKPQRYITEMTSASQPSFSVKSEFGEEQERIKNALASCGGNRASAAALLNISVTTLWRKMKYYKML